MIIDGREYKIEDCKIIFRHRTIPESYFMVQLDEFRMCAIDIQRKKRSKSCCMAIFFSVVPYSGWEWLEISGKKIPDERKIIEEAFGYPPEIDFLCGDLDVYTVEEFEKLPPPKDEWRQEFYIINDGKLEELHKFFEYELIDGEYGQKKPIGYKRKKHA